MLSETVTEHREDGMGVGGIAGRRVRTYVVKLALLGAAAIALWLVAATAAQARSHWSNWGAAIASIRHGHGYRRGVVPNRHHWSASSTANAAVTSQTLEYGGGVSGVGVTDGAPKVYLVFWGTQWGTQGTSNGYLSLSNDPAGMAPYLQAFVKGLGTDNELWSGVMTQYCQGVSTGAYSCPSSADHVGYPTGGALAGVWYDNSAAAPSAASGHQIGAEAVRAATHFGNTTAASNRETQYVIVSPTGTDPDYYEYYGFCAWHDYTADSTLDGGGAVSSPDGTLAFTNLPYLTDAGSGCGQNFVNSGSTGTLDGVSIVEGHEYAETITDQFPAGGWTVPNNGSSYAGEEDGDLCAWISPGTPGGGQNLTLATGSFAVQTTWSNDGNTCLASHAIVTNSGNTVTVTNPGNQTSTVGSAVSLQISASDSAGASLTYSASGLPAGLSISSSGLISGTPTTAGTSSVTVTAKDSTGASGSTSFTWTVSSSGSGGCTAKQLLGNPGFETGSASPWTMTAGVLNNSPAEPPHSGSWDAWLDGYGTTHTDTLAQKVSIPSGCSNYTFSFWLHIDTSETTTSTAYDTLKVQVLNSSGTVVATLATYSNLNHASGYTQRTFSLAAYAGQTVTLKFTGHEDVSLQTSFVVDDAALNVS
jgi:serine protease